MADWSKLKTQAIAIASTARSRVKSLLAGGPVLSVDLGGSAIKIALIAEEAGGLEMKAWGHAPLDVDPEAPADDRKAKMIDVLRQVLSIKGLKLKRAATSLSGNSVLVRYVRFPSLSPAELAAVLPIEAEPFIPFDINEVQLSFHVLGEAEEDGQKKMDTVLVAAKRDLVSSRVDVLRDAGLSPALIDVDSFALENVCARLPEGQAGTTLCLNIGHSATNLSLIADGATRVVRDIFIGGHAVTKAVMKELSCDYARAEEFKKSCGLFLDEEKSRALQEQKNDELAAAAAAAQVVKDLVTEVHRSVDFYLSQGPDRAITGVVLSGGSARLKNLPHFLSEDLKVPVSLLNPMAALKQIPDDFPAELSPSFAVAVGLALRCAGGAP
ncbi:MAG TPA: type IV pilus assembly protein PilM [Elusimicrobiota bacterium]|nr:type IV pilus assembly protein PilM [Elusimicrobiota bacterium]HVC09721.1 type IV pilus assembly protein PilM [Elusimicrobiota bacterium]